MSCVTEADCDQNNLCNGPPTCIDKQCVYGSPLIVDDKNACTADACDEATGEVTHTPKKVGDGDPCTIDTCDPATGVKNEPIAGCAGCTDDASCDDSNPCTKDICGKDTNCSHTNLESGEECNSSGGCLQAGKCDGKGVCVDGQPKPKPTATLCEQVICTEKGEWAAVQKPIVATSKCDDFSCDPNTGTIVVTPKDMSDGDPCTTDTCDPDTGKPVHEIIKACDGCKVDTDCTDANPCTKDKCEVSTGNCLPSEPLTGTTCSAATVCKTAGTCDAGTCKTQNAPGVDDNDDCTEDTCSVGTGIVHTPVDKDECCSGDAHCKVQIEPSGASAATCHVGGICDTATHRCEPSKETTRVDASDCTLDLCNTSTGEVTHPRDMSASGCCAEDADCVGGAVGNHCFTNGTCNKTTFKCEGRVDKAEIPASTLCSKYECDNGTVTEHSNGSNTNGCCTADLDCYGYEAGEQCFGPTTCADHFQCGGRSGNIRPSPDNSCTTYKCNPGTGEWVGCCATGATPGECAICLENPNALLCGKLQ